MTNAEKFRNVFGLYATEVWSMSEKEFLAWLNRKAQSNQMTGRWIVEEEDYIKQTRCSECGVNAPFVLVADDHYGNNVHGESRKTKFCPNCGARMEDVESDEQTD